MLKRNFLSIAVLSVITHLGFSQVQIGQAFEGDSEQDRIAVTTKISGDGQRLFFNNGSFTAAYDWDNYGWQSAGAVPFSGINGLDATADGEIIAISRKLYAGNTNGEARIYQQIDNDWIQLGQRLLGTENMLFGSSIALSADGNRVAVGAHGADNNGVPNIGKVFIYDYDGTTWQQKGQTIFGKSEQEQIGFSIDISQDGNRIVFGQNTRSETELPLVRVYKLEADLWVQMGDDLLGFELEDGFGTSVAMSHDGKRIACGVPQISNSHNKGHARVFEEINGNWTQLGNALDIDGGGLSGISIDISGDGRRVLLGAPYYPTMGAQLYEENNGNWDRISYNIFDRDESEAFGRSISLSSDGRRFSVGDYLFDNQYLNAGELRVFELPNLFGKIFSDDNVDCLYDNTENPIINRAVLINPGNTIVHSNEQGVWQYIVPETGEFSLTYDTLGPYRSNCPQSQYVAITDITEPTEATPFGLERYLPCSDPFVDIHMPLIRPCRDGQIIYAQLCNSTYASDSISAGELIITLDPAIELTSANAIFTDLGNNKFAFEHQAIGAESCFNIELNTRILCSVIAGQTLCMNVRVNPENACERYYGNSLIEGLTCTFPYDSSMLSMSTTCLGDSVQVVITNNGQAGTGDMQCSAQVRFYHEALLIGLDTIKLNGGVAKTYKFFSNGEMFRVECDQHPFYPGERTLINFIELCGDPVSWTPDQINLFDLGDSYPTKDVFCGVATASFDPNDKIGYPYGLGPSNFIQPNQNIEYVIRFQNTGTDTAFDVIIIDTLDTNFNRLTFRPGLSSHSYALSQIASGGKTVLVWQFLDIKLPDSTIDEANSHGFLKFEISPYSNLPELTRLTNNADIYFDFNDPIRTNTTFHTINKETILYSSTKSVEQYQNSALLQIIPNPNRGECLLQFSQTSNEVNLKVYNSTGELVSRQINIRSNEYWLKLPIATGLYFIVVESNDGIVQTEKVMVIN